MSENTETTIETTTETTETTTSSIDDALARAKAARKKDGTTRMVRPTTATTPAASTEDTEAEKAEKERQREAKRLEREARIAAKKAELEEARAEKRARREQKRAEREAKRAGYVPHMAKVEKAAEQLPDLSDEAQEAFELISGLSNTDLSAVLAHGEHVLRVNSTKASPDCKLEEGQLVEVTAGPAQYLGLKGTVTELRRIRVLVDVPGRDKPIYLFRSDCTPVATTAAESDETDVEVDEADEADPTESEAVAS